MLGRSVGLSEEKMAHLADEVLPDDVYDEKELAIIRYARRSTRAEPIDDELYAELERHFTREQIVELCFTVGLSNFVNRFHATFHTDVDATTWDALGGSCPLPLPEV